MTNRTGTAALCFVAALATLAGCSDSKDPATPTSTATASAGSAQAAPAAGGNTFGCLTGEQAGKGSVTVQDAEHSDAAYFQDADAGRAEVAVVLLHQAGGSLCDWVPALGSFTKAGYAVLAVNRSGDVLDDLGAVDQFLESRKVAQVVLVGAADSATALLDKSASPVSSKIPVKAVVALSALQKSGVWNAAGNAEFNRMPTFFAAGRDDRTAAADAQALYDKSVHAAPGKRLRFYPGTGHGADLLRDVALPDVLTFLAERVPATSTPTPTAGAA
ncbi:hypothetical protein OG689_39040 [Kitasatospora sp. NBC_00240]|uniref:alpha/beta hydrolase n=1 Tax=Kitasatospora sp. NBC_00240 TaxID=2903567 RepID=UPI00225C2DAD|nr:hypothetical protein [Kitasatospora sp. NBC_00240]MCX5215191.1 hypothetical protein [Kitasatospora sp. NBC_00240]